MSSTVTLIRADGLAPSMPYAAAAILPADARLVLLAGACPLDAEGRTVAIGDVAGQAAACVRSMTIALGAAGAGVGDAAFVRVLVATTVRSDLSAAWDVVHDAFGDREPPGTLQGVTVLGWPDQLVEVEVVAAVRS